MKAEQKSKTRRIDELAALRRELSELKASYQAVMEEKRKYKEFLDNTDDYCLEADLAGNIIFCNVAAYQTLGYEREEYLNLKRADRYASLDEAERVLQIYKEIFRTGKSVERFNSNLRKKDGTILTVEVSASLIRDAEGKPIGFRGIARDITERIKMEQEQERYRTFLEGIDENCFETDLKGNLIFFNEALCRSLGYGREELQKMNYLQTETDDVAQQIYKIYNEVYKTGNVVTLYDFEMIRPNEQSVFLDITISLIRDSAGNPIGFRSISRDVTERKKSEEDLKRYKDFVENIDDSCYEFDLIGRFTFANDACCRLSGYTHEELLSLPPEHLYASKEERKRIRPVYWKVLTSGIPQSVVYQCRKKTGELISIENVISRICDAKGLQIGYRGISRDVTERIKMEQQQARYHTFFESIDDICFENDLQGTVTFFNNALCRILSKSSEELQNANYQQLFSADTVTKIYPIYNEIYRTGKSATLYDVEIASIDGFTRFLDITVNLIHDAQGNPIGFRGVAKDVTERKKMEEERERLKAQLAQSEKLEAIGILAGGVAHNFNNLLMGIQGYASIMLMDMDSSHPHYEHLKMIEAQVKSGAGLTKQLLGYARGGHYQIIATDMNDLIRRTATMFGRTKKDIRIDQKLTDDLSNTRVDQGQMEQVLLNLFVNAAQAMPGGGTLYLETENIVLDENDVKPHDVAPGSYIKISVTDTGIGMDEKVRQHIFEPFFTTKDMGHGAGLGLASAYGIIKGHQGIINCYSEKGHGTTFNIYLPAIAAEETRQEPQTTTMVSKQITILLVDDEKTITDVTGAMLGKLGHEVIIAHSGKEAVALYQVNRDRIDLVIMDMIMPDMNGGDAIEQIKLINSDVKILLSSGYSINGLARKIMNRGGAHGFLQKPFRLHQLVDKINEIIDT